MPGRRHEDLTPFRIKLPFFQEQPVVLNREGERVWNVVDVLTGSAGDPDADCVIVGVEGKGFDRGFQNVFGPRLESEPSARVS